MKLPLPSVAGNVSWAVMSRKQKGGWSEEAEEALL